MRHLCTVSLYHEWEDAATPLRDLDLRDCPDHSPHESEGQDHREMQEKREEEGSL